MPRDRPALAGVVLTGGASSRMGRDKAAIEVGGVALLDRALATLDAVAAPVVVAVGASVRADLPASRLQVLDGSHVGPLAGLVAAADLVSRQGPETPLLAALAVDTPNATPGLYAALAERWAGESAVVLVTDGRVQPLLAVYAVATLRSAATALDAGERSPSRWLSTQPVRTVELAELLGEGIPSDVARNLNMPDDLKS